MHLFMCALTQSVASRRIPVGTMTPEVEKVGSVNLLCNGKHTGCASMWNLGKRVLERPEKFELVTYNFSIS